MHSKGRRKWSDQLRRSDRSCLRANSDNSFDVDVTKDASSRRSPRSRHCDPLKGRPGARTTVPQTLSARADEVVETHDSKYQSDLSRPFQAIPGLWRSSAYGRSSASRTDGSRAERTPVRRGGPLHNRRHHGVGGNRYRGPFGRHKNSSGARVFDPLVRARVEPSKRQRVKTETYRLTFTHFPERGLDLSARGAGSEICICITTGLAGPLA